jgi:hypothetical protein
MTTKSFTNKTSIMKILTNQFKLAAKEKHAQKKGHSMQNFNKIVKKAYKVEEDPLEYMKKNGGEWASYPYNDFLDPDIKNNEVLKDQFVAYMSGWLQYYDEVSRNNAIDHIAYFHWDTDRVTVYIAPAPGNASSPIVPPAGRTSSDPQDPSSPPPPYPEPSTT